MRRVLLVAALASALRPTTRKAALRRPASRFTSSRCRWWRASLADAPATTARRAAASDASILPTAPKVVTIDPIGTLLQRAVPEGLILRDALLSATGLMLPRPDVFQTAYDAAVANAPAGFGAGRCSAADWRRAVCVETYDAILRTGLYDEDELAAYERALDQVLEAVAAEDASSDAWDAAPGAPRLLAALREWRDLGGGPRLVACTEAYDERLEALLQSVLGPDVVAATFDFVVAGGGEGSAFEAAAAKHGEGPGGCQHVAAAAGGCPYPVLLVDTGEEADDDAARSNLLDLLDDWGLPRAEGDDVIVTSRTYSVYEKEPAGFDGEG